MKYQTRCVAAFPDQQGFLVCIQLLITFKYTSRTVEVLIANLLILYSAIIWGNSAHGLGLIFPCCEGPLQLEDALSCVAWYGTGSLESTMGFFKNLGYGYINIKFTKYTCIRNC